MYHEKENALLREYLSSVEILIKEYLDKTAGVPNTAMSPGLTVTPERMMHVYSPAQNQDQR